MNMGGRVGLALMGLLVILQSCAGSPARERSSDSANKGVSVRNDGRTLHFDTTPRRVVTMNHNGTELFLALGLDDRMVGTAWRDHPILPRYRDEYQRVPELSDRYPSLEVLLEVQPDFVYGWRSAFQPPKGPATRSRLRSFGMTPYLDRMYADTDLRLKDVYREIRTLGRIFRVEDRADSLVESMRRNIKKVRRRLPRREEAREVVVYNSGVDSFYAAGRALVSDLVRVAGGRNVLANDVPDAYGSVSWETVVDENPDCIVILDYGSVPVERKKETLLQHPGMDGVKAVREDCFVVLPLAATFVGVRNDDAVLTLARGFYPGSFPETP